MQTIVGGDSMIRGDLNSRGTLRIDGTIEGRVRADWVVVGEPGTIRGDVVCRGVVVGGKVEGTIHSSELVDIKTKGQVFGEVYTARLTVSGGGVLEGRSYMIQSKETDGSGVLPFVLEKL